MSGRPEGLMWTVGFRVFHRPWHAGTQTSLLRGQTGKEHEALISGVDLPTISGVCGSLSRAHATSSLIRTWEVRPRRWMRLCVRCLLLLLPRNSRSLYHGHPNLSRWLITHRLYKTYGTSMTNLWLLYVPGKSWRVMTSSWPAHHITPSVCGALL